MSSILLPVSGAQVELADHAPLKMRELREWGQAEAAGNFEIVYPYVARLITSWTLDLDPKDPASLDDLDMRDFGRLNREISALIQRTASEKN